MILIIKMLLQEIKYHVTSPADIRRVHRHLTEEILEIRIENGQCTETIPQVVQGEDAFGVAAHVLIFQRHERPSQLYGIGHIVLKKLIGEMEKVAGGQLRLPIVVQFPVGTVLIPIASDNLIRFGIPHNQLLVTVVASVEFIDIHGLSGASASGTKGNFAQSSNLLHHVG